LKFVETFLLKGDSDYWQPLAFAAPGFSQGIEKMKRIWGALSPKKLLSYNAGLKS